MNQISLILFLITVCAPCSLQSKPKHAKQEMTVFFDRQIHTKKIDPLFLDTPYNLHKIRKIISSTEQLGKPPTHTLEFFRPFMVLGNNSVALRALVEEQVHVYIDDPTTARAAANTLNQLVQLAFLAHSQETLEKELRTTQAQRRQLENAMGISGSHS
jgi:hypothetical protein